MWSNIQFPADFVTLTREILKWKLHLMRIDFEPAQYLSSGVVDESCAAAITTTLRCQKQWFFLSINLYICYPTQKGWNFLTFYRLINWEGVTCNFNASNFRDHCRINMIFSGVSPTIIWSILAKWHPWNHKAYFY